MNDSRGFTLVELMVTLAVAAILMALAAPSMRDMLQNNRITTQANELLTSLSIARSEAVRTGTPVGVCRSGNMTTCSAGAGDWASGWIVFGDLNGNGAVDAGEMIMRVQQPLKGNPTLTGPAPITYLSTGMVNAAAVFTHTIPGCTGDQGRIINLSATGRAMVTKSAC